MASASTSVSRTASIRTWLLGAVAALSILATGTLAWQAATDWRVLSQAETARQADAAANRFAAGLYEVLGERLTTNNALQAATPAT